MQENQWNNHLSQAISSLEYTKNRFVARKIWQCEAFVSSPSASGHVEIPWVQVWGEASLVPYGSSQEVSQTESTIASKSLPVVDIETLLEIPRNYYQMAVSQNSLLPLETHLAAARTHIDQKEEQILFFGARNLSLIGCTNTDEFPNMPIMNPFTLEDPFAVIDLFSVLIQKMEQYATSPDIALILPYSAGKNMMQKLYSTLHDMTLEEYFTRRGIQVVYAPILNDTPQVIVASKNPLDITIGAAPQIQVNQFVVDPRGNYRASAFLSHTGLLVKNKESLIIGTFM